jgi:quinol monooxygenase YgiN
MQYIQLVEFDASHQVDEVRDSLDAWLAISRGKRTLQMSVVAADHDRPNHYWQLLMFPSERDAEASAQLPETKSAFERWSELLDGEPVFHNLDVVAQLGGPTAPSVDWQSATTPGAG